MTAVGKSKMSFAEYVAREKTSDVRHEFEGGDVFAMTGGSPEHAALVSSVHLAIGSKLAEGCRSYVESLRVRVPSGKTAYPDVFVICGRVVRDPVDEDTVTNPILIVEVLSDSTEAYDRGDKFAHYRSCPSLTEYVLVSQRVPRLERFVKTNGVWTICNTAGRGELMHLTSVDVVLEVDAVYRGLVREDGSIRVA